MDIQEIRDLLEKARFELPVLSTNIPTRKLIGEVLDLIEQQPSELTEKLKRRLPNVLPDSYEGMKSLCATLTDTVKEACSIIDSFERQPTAGEFRQKVTCALLDCRSTEEQCKVALKLLHESEDIIDTAEAIKTDLVTICTDALTALKKIKKTQKIDPFYLDVLIAVLEKQTGCRPPVEGETDNPDPIPSHEFPAKAVGD